MTDADFWFAEHISRQAIFLHGATDVLFARTTAYQRMYIIASPTLGKALFLDNKLQSATVDEFLYHESLVHPACIAFGRPRSLLVLGGGEGATIREALRWKTIEKVMMVDIDSEVVEACRAYLPEMSSGSFDDVRAHLVHRDALDFLSDSDRRWDVIIADLSEPIERGPSWKLFTKESFELARSRLAPGGCLAMQAGPVGPQYLISYARLVKTLEAVFPYIAHYAVSIPSFPAPWGFLLGSLKPFNSRPETEAINKLLEEGTIGGMRMLDGEALLGLLQSPLYIRQAIAMESRIVTIDAPAYSIG